LSSLKIKTTNDNAYLRLSFFTKNEALDGLPALTCMSYQHLYSIYDINYLIYNIRTFKNSLAKNYANIFQCLNCRFLSLT
jgi:hypothetical protein